MLTIQECKKILEKDGTMYSDEEIEILRDVLYKIAEIDIQQINNN
jgi:DNA-directed RNA polymerase subunit F